MLSLFPQIITDLPKAEVKLNNATFYISQAKNHQIIFMEFGSDVNLPKHFHEAQWELVIKGKVDLFIDGEKHTYKKGDQFFIPKGVKHSGKIYAGYTSIAFFNQHDRYTKKH
jgi:quercetin dioxygenase-like cupin family protein